MNKFKRFSALLAVVLVFIFTFSAISQNNIVRAENASHTQEVTQEESTDSSTGQKAMAAAVAIGLSAAGAALGMGIAIAKAADGISRQPEADGKIRTSLMLGLVFVETVVIYALIVAILIIFVL